MGDRLGILSAVGLTFVIFFFFFFFNTTKPNLTSASVYGHIMLKAPVLVRSLHKIHFCDYMFELFFNPPCDSCISQIFLSFYVERQHIK